MAGDVGTVNASEDNKEFQDLVTSKFSPQPSGSAEACGDRQVKAERVEGPSTVEGKGTPMDLCSDNDERQAQPAREEFGSRWGQGVVNLARDPSSESRASSKFSSSSGCEAAAELIREFTDRLRSTLRSNRGLQTARKDQQQPMIRLGQWRPPLAESFPHARCGIRNPVAAGERMAGEQPHPIPAHTSVPDASSGIHHRSWGTGGSEGGGAGDMVPPVGDVSFYGGASPYYNQGSNGGSMWVEHDGWRKDLRTKQ